LDEVPQRLWVWGESVSRQAGPKRFAGRLVIRVKVSAIEHSIELGVVLFDGNFLAGEWIPNTLSEISREPGFGIGGLADSLESAASVFAASVVEVIVPPTFFPALDHAFKITTSLIEPSVNFIRRAVGKDLLRVILGFEDGDTSYANTLRVESKLSSCLAIASKLASHFPLYGPRRSKTGSGLFIIDINPAVGFCNHVRSSSIEQRISSNWVVDWERNRETELNSLTTVRELEWGSSIRTKRIVVKIKFKSASCSFKRFCAVGRAFEVSVFSDKSLKASSN